jgi:hypothetical protein
MTKDGFVTTVKDELRGRAHCFRRADLIAFIEGAWPEIIENPCARQWADAFMAAEA